MGDLLAVVAPPDLLEQRGEILRELTLRSRVYPRLIARGELRADRAEYQVACLQAAAATISRLIGGGT